MYIKCNLFEILKNTIFITFFSIIFLGQIFIKRHFGVEILFTEYLLRLFFIFNSC